MLKTRLLEFVLIALLSAMVIASSTIYLIFFMLTILTISFKFRLVLPISLITAVLNWLIFMQSTALIVNIVAWPLFVSILKILTLKLKVSTAVERPKSPYLFLTTFLLIGLVNLGGVLFNTWFLATPFQEMLNSLWFYALHTILNALLVFFLAYYFKKRLADLGAKMGVMV